MKKALEWFEQLPEPIRSQAIENWEKSDWEGKDRLFESLPSSLILTFDWELTLQKRPYWVNIEYRASNGEFDQPNLHGWIPVGERLPEESDADEFGNVLILTETKKEIAHISLVKMNLHGLQFWKPLPKLPEVKS